MRPQNVLKIHSNAAVARLIPPHTETSSLSSQLTPVSWPWALVLSYISVVLSDRTADLSGSRTLFAVAREHSDGASFAECYVPRSQMNFNRHSLCEDLLFAMVLLLPPVCAAARYVESDRQFAGISQTRSEAVSVAARTRAPERWVIRTR